MLKVNMLSRFSRIRYRVVISRGYLRSLLFKYCKRVFKRTGSSSLEQFLARWSWAHRPCSIVSHNFLLEKMIQLCSNEILGASYTPACRYVHTNSNGAHYSFAHNFPSNYQVNWGGWPDELRDVRFRGSLSKLYKRAWSHTHSIKNVSKYLFIITRSVN